MTNANKSTTNSDQEAQIRVGDVTAGIDSLNLKDIDLNVPQRFSSSAGRIATMTPLPSNIGVVSIDDTVRVSLQCDSFLAVSDWGGTRAPKVFPNWNDPLFAEYIANHFSGEDILKAVESILNKARSSDVSTRLGLRASVGLRLHSLHPSIIPARFNAGSDRLSEEQNEVAGLLLTAYYNHINMLADTPRLVRISRPNDLVPSREQLIQRAHVFRVLAALTTSVKDMDAPLDSSDLNTAAIDAHMSRVFETLYLAVVDAERAKDYIELGLEAMRAFMLRESMPQLPQYIISNARIPALVTNATLAFAALHPGSNTFAMTLGTPSEILKDTAMSANFAAYAAFLDPALDFIEKWLTNDPYFTVLPLSSAVECLSVSRVMENTTKTIRGGVIRFGLRDIDGSAVMAHLAEGMDSSFFALRSGAGTSIAGAPLVASMQPIVRGDRNAALTDILSSALESHDTGMIATFVPDPVLVQLAAMALSDEVILQFNVDPEAKGDFFVMPESSELTMLFRHRIVDAAGYLSDLQAEVLASMADTGQMGVTDRSDIDEVDGEEPPLPFSIDPSKLVDGRFALRVGASDYLYSVDPRIVLLSSGERQVVKPWEMGVHRLDFAGMHRHYVVGAQQHEAVVDRVYAFSEERIGRFGPVALSMKLSDLMGSSTGGSLFLQPMQIFQMNQYFSLFSAVTDLLNDTDADDQMTVEGAHLHRQLFASKVLADLNDFLGTSDQSRLQHIIRTIAFEMQRNGVLKQSLSRFPDDDRRLALFILQCIYITAVGTFAGIDSDADEILEQMHELMQSDTFKNVFAVSSLAMNISL